MYKKACPTFTSLFGSVHNLYVYFKMKTKSFQSLIDTLRCMFNSDQVDIDQVQSLMRSYESDPSEWIKYTYCNPHRLDRSLCNVCQRINIFLNRYTRNLIDIGNGKYNLMILCWPPGSVSSIHDHSDAHCVMRVSDARTK